MSRPGGSCNHETARHRASSLARRYGSLRATLHAMELEAESLVALAPPSFKPLFQWYQQNLAESFNIINRPKPTAEETRDQRDFRNLASELGFEK